MFTLAEDDSPEWDGSLPHEFLSELANFSAGRNAGGLILWTVPGRQNIIVDQFLGRAIQCQFGLEGEALKAAETMVRRKCREDLAPIRQEPRGWLDSWRGPTWADLNAIGRARMGIE